MKVFITGSAGFIGFHLARRLIEQGHEVMGYDGMTTYYDIDLKRARLGLLHKHENFTGVEAMLEDRDVLREAVGRFEPEVIVHLAAQAGVRYSLDHPQTYISSNLIGTYNVIETAKEIAPRHLLFASTSSVYGGNEKYPFCETDRADHPVSLYAATKKSCEELTHSYSHLFKIPTTCFRFFTVYGPWGRPDMALFKFVRKILELHEPIEVFGEGKMRRDFTYIDDLIHGIELLINCAPIEGEPINNREVTDSLSPVAPWRTVNIAGGHPVELMEFIEIVEKHVGMQAQKVLMPLQKGDVHATVADAGLLKAITGYQPSTSVDEGVAKFVSWYREYRGV